MAKMSEWTAARLRLTAACLVAVWALGAPARAEQVTAADLKTFLSIARSWGAAEIVERGVQGAHIRGEISGVAYAVHFFECAPPRKGCRDFQFRAVWNARAARDPAGRAMQRINSWNRERRLGVGFIDRDGSVVLKLNGGMAYGGERRAVEGLFKLWRSALVEFPRFFFR